MWTLEELLALWNDEATRADMTLEQLDALSTLLGERAEEIAAAFGDGVPSDEQSAELAEIADTIEAVGVRSGEVQSEQDEQRSTATSLLDRIRAQQAADGDGEGGDSDGAGDAGDGDQADDGDAGAGDGADDGGGDSGDAGDAGDGDGSGDQADGEGEGTQAVAAGSGSTPPRRRTRIGGVAARRVPASVRPQARTRNEMVLVAAANVQNLGIHAGQELTDPVDIGAAFLHAWEQGAGFSGPGPQKVVVAYAGARRVEDVYPEDRILGRDPALNHARLNRVVSRDAIVAAGGRCVPSETRYDLPTIVGSESQPVRDEMMVRFGAARGGVVTLTAPVLSDVDGAISVWTEENDQNPTNPTTKPCLTVECPDDSESIVDAIVQCLKFGNFRAQFFGEQIQAIMDLTAVQHARRMETRRLDAIFAGSAHKVAGQLLGTTRDVKAALIRASEQIHDVHRLDDSFPLRVGMPEWLIGQCQVDLARQMPVGTLAETLAVAEAEILRFFAVENLNITLTKEIKGTGVTFSDLDADGPLEGWPDKVNIQMYPEGTWLDVDGGRLDLGIQREVGTPTNDFQVFAESWQASHKHGNVSWDIELDVCPDGSASALVDIAPCLVGS